MPELPEVETVRRGIEPHLVGRRIEEVVVRESRLRLPVDPGLAGELAGRVVEAVGRRGKYLLIASGPGAVLMHLGMSGSLRLVTADTVPGRHDHVDIRLDDGRALRFNDPRRFGLVVWAPDTPLEHRLLARLGPEPLDPAWDGTALRAVAVRRRSAIKAVLMEARVVVGVGNIYASEALFRAGIHPLRPACRISARRYEALATAVKAVLTEAIEQGGTTLRDFVAEDGRPGYFQQSLHVYGRTGRPCGRCGRPIRETRLAGRSSYYCPGCQR